MCPHTHLPLRARSPSAPLTCTANNSPTAAGSPGPAKCRGHGAPSRYPGQKHPTSLLLDSWGNKGVASVAICMALACSTAQRGCGPTRSHACLGVDSLQYTPACHVVSQVPKCRRIHGGGIGGDGGDQSWLVGLSHRPEQGQALQGLGFRVDEQGQSSKP